MTSTSDCIDAAIESRSPSASQEGLVLTEAQLAALEQATAAMVDYGGLQAG